jgi:hypothetical protein
MTTQQEQNSKQKFQTDATAHTTNNFLPAHQTLLIG